MQLCMSDCYLKKKKPKTYCGSKITLKSVLACWRGNHLCNTHLGKESYPVIVLKTGVEIWIKQRPKAETVFVWGLIQHFRMGASTRSAAPQPEIQVPEPDPQTQKEEGCYTMFYKQEKPSNNPWDRSAATALAVLLRQNSLGWSAHVLSCSKQFSSRSSLRVNISNTSYHQLQKGLFVMGCKMSEGIKLRQMLTAPSCPQSAVQCGANMMRQQIWLLMS